MLLGIFLQHICIAVSQNAICIHLQHFFLPQTDYNKVDKNLSSEKVLLQQIRFKKGKGVIIQAVILR